MKKIGLVLILLLLAFIVTAEDNPSDYEYFVGKTVEVYLLTGGAYSRDEWKLEKTLESGILVSDPWDENKKVLIRYEYIVKIKEKK